ncbi:MAG TPA: hypothetical protein VIN37_02820 [Candidatus Limnocylindria bacterium]|jgi:hypothetical protein
MKLICLDGPLAGQEFETDAQQLRIAQPGGVYAIYNVRKALMPESSANFFLGKALTYAGDEVPPTMRDETLENPHLHTSGGDPDCDICVALVDL